MSPSRPERLLLIGMMGAGKSTVGHLVAGLLGWPYLDSDDEIRRRTGRTVPEIWHSDGEAAFRAQESAVLAEATSGTEPVVVAVAGGAVLDPANRERIVGTGLVVWLRARPETLAARVGDGAGRPLLDDDPATALLALDQARRPVYQDLADVSVDVDNRTPTEVADLVVAEVVRHRTATTAAPSPQRPAPGADRTAREGQSERVVPPGA